MYYLHPPLPPFRHCPVTRVPAHATSATSPGPRDVVALNAGRPALLDPGAGTFAVPTSPPSPHKVGGNPAILAPAACASDRGEEEEEAEEEEGSDAEDDDEAEAVG